MICWEILRSQTCRPDCLRFKKFKSTLKVYFIFSNDLFANFNVWKSILGVYFSNWSINEVHLPQFAQYTSFILFWLKSKLSILQMYFISWKYKRSILEVYFKYTEILQGERRRSDLNKCSELFWMTLYFNRVHNYSQDCSLPYGPMKLSYNISSYRHLKY